jgi:putative heme-binding domain-containing protein
MLWRASILIVVLAGSLGAQQHAGVATPADLERGARLYHAHCAACHGAEGDQVTGVDLRRGQFRRGSSDEEVMRTISNGVPGTAMVPIKLAAPELAAVAAFVRSLRETGGRVTGDAARGQRVYEGKGACAACHRVAGRGSRLGPDLTEIGALRTAEALERSLVDPGRPVPPQHRFVRAVTAGGRMIEGRRLNEDTFTVQLIDQQERLVSLRKSELREYTVLKNSPMPSYKGQLTAAELADLIAYLASLKGVPKP